MQAPGFSLAHHAAKIPPNKIRKPKCSEGLPLENVKTIAKHSRCP